MNGFNLRQHGTGVGQLGRASFRFELFAKRGKGSGTQRRATGLQTMGRAVHLVGIALVERGSQSLEQLRGFFLIAQEERVQEVGGFPPL